MQKIIANNQLYKHHSGLFVLYLKLIKATTLQTYARTLKLERITPPSYDININ